jgi:hypothetical protein
VTAPPPIATPVVTAPGSGKGRRGDQTHEDHDHEPSTETSKSSHAVTPEETFWSSAWVGPSGATSRSNVKMLSSPVRS